MFSLVPSAVSEAFVAELFSWLRCFDPFYLIKVLIHAYEQ